MAPAMASSRKPRSERVRGRRVVSVLRMWKIPAPQAASSALILVNFPRDYGIVAAGGQLRLRPISVALTLAGKPPIRRAMQALHTPAVNIWCGIIATS
jgi:hypothetical protein